MAPQFILIVIQSDLQLICSLRSEFEQSGLAQLIVARSSQEAILYLRGVGIYEDRERFPLPSIIVFDCESPDPCDLEVLSWVRETPATARLPVVMLCNERHRQLRVSCALDPACYLVHRSTTPELIETVRNIGTSAVPAQQSLSHPEFAR